MYQSQRHGRGYVVTIRDEIDSANASLLAAELTKGAMDGSGALVVDLLGCRYVDSSGLNVFVKQGRTLGKRFRLVVGDGTYLRRLFDATGLSKALALDQSVEDALAAGFAAAAPTP